tara:strand:- start:1853 stop:2758 length:906 start_codon:yes stop_codon:yes gene_type:complete
MTKVLKVFIATSSFSENLDNTYRVKGNKKFKLIKNPIQKKLTGDQLIKYAKDCEYIIAGTENYSKEIIDNLTSLKYLFRMGSGVDNIDIKYLKKKKIGFSKSKVTPEIAVAELIVGCILSFYRNLSEHDQNLKNLIWQKKMGSVLNGKTLGIIGFGKVGRYLSKILKNFGVRVLINDNKKIRHTNTGLIKLIKNSDIISVNANLTNKKPLLCKNKLSLCKKNCLIVNTSRPELIDNEYLYILLKNEKILGACMDVFDKEPYYGKFTKLKNVLLTPHIGSYSKEIRSAMEKEALMSVINIKN